MGKRSVTIVVTFADDDAGRLPVDIGNPLLGGTITGIATYDLIHTMEIAEAALESQNPDECIDAIEKIEDYTFAGGINENSTH